MLLVYGIELKHTRMDSELLNYINVDLKWNIVKKGRRSMARRPRNPGSEFGIKRQDPSFLETKKIVDAPSKKRRLLHQSPSPPPCLHVDGVLPPGPQTPSFHHEDPSQRYCSNSYSQSLKKKSKTRLRNSNISKPTKKDDFSGIELLAAAACSSFLHDNADHVDDQKVVKEEVHSCTLDIKEAILSTELNGAQNLHDNGNEKAAPSKGLRLHWDLNTVMDDWEEPCDDVAVEPRSREKSCEDVKLNLEGNESEERSMADGVSDAATSVVPLIGSCNGDSFGKTCESIEETCSQEEVMCTKMITSKTSDCESSGSKSYCDNKVASEDPPSDCCGSNVTQEEQGGGHMGEGADTMDKNEAGYDSPFEDGELRDPIGWEENGNSSNNSSKHDLGTIENPKSENPKSEKVETSLLVKDNDNQRDIKESDCGSGKEYSERNTGHHLVKNVTRNYSNNGNCYSRSWRDLCPERPSYEHHKPKDGIRNYTPRGGGYRRPSLSERNNGYDFHREPRSVSRDRYRFHDPKPCYLERKVRCYSPKRRSRSRSRSGSPIAWHFQKRKNLDVTQSPDHVSPERSVKSFDERKFTDGQFRDKRQSMIRQNQRFESIGYPERLKTDDHLRYTERSGRFFREHKYKEKGDAIRKHDGHYERVNRDADSVRR